MSTIAAISTPAGNGGVGIIRISGEDSLKIINKIFIPLKDGAFKPFSFKLGHILDDNKKIIDQVLISYFKAPKSYTGEDVCEINCHGGSIVLKKILDIVLKNGAQMAEAGEFTKRAFLNGKMDLTQAEAVIDLINAKNERAEKASAKQLSGKLRDKICNIKSAIIDILADIEANIDYPEYEDIEDVEHKKVLNIIDKQIDELKNLEASFQNGKILRDGISTAIIGKPNVGKSSLLNVLLNEERAIVTDIAGTTRDTIEEYANINGITLRLIDTAGIRKTSDAVESIGVEKSKKVLEEAELILFLIDASNEITNEDLELYNMIKNKPHIIIFNKIDLQALEITDFNDKNVVRISAKTAEGINELENKIEEIFNIKNLDAENDLVITNIRHKDLIYKARINLENACIAVKDGLPMDMISINISEAIKSLCEMIGESVREDVLNRIFEKFCVGK